MKNNKIILSFAITTILATTQTQADTAVGAFVNNDAWDISIIQQYNTDVARDAATINIFSSFNSDWESLSYQADNIVSSNAVPLITWLPSTGADSDENVLQEITEGKWDGYINRWIQGFKDWRNTYDIDKKPTIMLRFAHEFNGTWYRWGNQPKQLKAAWNYLHHRFDIAGVNNAISWVWCASATDVDDYNDINAYYPGDDVVDWLAIDGYNWGSNYSFSRWRSFDEIFSFQYNNMINEYPNKPIMLAEVASAEPHDQPDPAWGQDGDDSDSAESKEAWVADMMQSVQTDYPAIQAILWFNTNKELNWALNYSGNTGLNAYNDALSLPYFSAKLTEAKNPKKTKDNDFKYFNRIKMGKGKPFSYKKKSFRGIVKAFRHTPKVIGDQLRKREAEGIRKMPKEMLKKWRLNHILD